VAVGNFALSLSPSRSRIRKIEVQGSFLFIGMEIEVSPPPEQPYALAAIQHWPPPSPPALSNDGL
jgi:hypothetical protein